MFLFITCTDFCYAQLGNRHWIPPLGTSSQFIDYYQYIAISTPHTEPFIVTVKTSNNEIIAEQTVSHSSPAEVFIPRVGALAHRSLVYLLTLDDSIIEDRGILIEGEKTFQVNYRVHSSIHAGGFVSKGSSGLGRSFRSGHFQTSQGASNTARFHFISMMASEDNTVVTISDIPEGIKLQNYEEVVNAPITVELPTAGNSYVLGLRAKYNQENSLMGVKLDSDKPIAVISGSWTSSPGAGNHNDIGIDQLYPLERIGTEYILMKGNGPDILETPIIIANEDDTAVFIGGESSPSLVLNAGEYHVLSSDHYSSEGNLYLSMNKPTYIYQSIGGRNDGDQTNEATGSLNQIPPLSCGISGEEYTISLIDMLGPQSYSASLSILSRKGASLTINDGLISTGAPRAVPGNPDYETYQIQDLTGDIQVRSEEAIQFFAIGSQDYSSWSTYYGGVSEEQELAFEFITLTECPTTLLFQTNIEGQIEWYFEDKIVQQGNSPIYTTTTEGVYSVVFTYEIDCGQVQVDTFEVTVDACNITEVEKADKMNLKLYPNPTNDRLYIDWQRGKGPMPIALFLITDITGQQVQHWDSVGLSNGQHILEVDKLPSGTYFLHLKTEGGKEIITKFIRL